MTASKNNYAQVFILRIPKRVIIVITTKPEAMSYKIDCVTCVNNTLIKSLKV